MKKKWLSLRLIMMLTALFSVFSSFAQQAFVESFETYASDADLANTWSSQNSGYFSVSLSGDHVTQGSQSMRIDYNIDQKIGVINWNFNGDFSGHEGIAMSLAGDNSGRTFSIDVKEQSGEHWEASTIIRGTEEVFFAFADMTSPNNGDGIVDPATFTNFSIFVSGEAGEGTIYIDNIRAANDADVNSLPVAIGGGDKTVRDPDKNGSELVTLDASGSYDPDGSIVSYSWTDASGTEIATGATSSVAFATGTHNITLTLTDNEGATTVSAFTIKVLAPGETLGGFKVSGTQIIDAYGTPFVMRGINVAHAWFRPRTSQSLADIAATGANSVRIVLATGDQWARVDGNEVAKIINQCKNLEMVPVLEVHDATGWAEKAGSANPDLMLDYWLSPDIRAAIDGQEEYVIINIANEPMGNDKTSVWESWHKSAINTLRTAGIKHALMIDAPNWGQDWSQTMPGVAESVFESDPDKNVIFSVHMYDSYGTANAVLSYIDKFVSMNLPLVVGEFADNHGVGAEVAEATIMQHCEDVGYGYLGWSWSGNGSPLEPLDVVEGFDANVLTTWGDILINGANGIAATSVTATVFEGYNKIPEVFAGANQSVVDFDGSGTEAVTFDGSTSYDIDGTIVSYSWTVDGIEIATGVSPTVEMPVGTSVVTLTATDNEGGIGKDDITVVVNAAGARFNAALNKPATASTTSNDAGDASAAVDGDLATRWSSEYLNNQWLEVDLQSTFTIDEVVLAWEGAYAKNYSIEISEDRTNWTSIYATSSSDGGTVSHAVSGEGRYIRLNCEQRATGWGSSVWEFEVWGTIAGGNQAPIANAGSDQSATDDDANGSETFTLNASGSSDPDGSIVSYSWKNTSGTEIATGVTAIVEFTEGEHDITLTVVDNLGAIATDTVTVKVLPAGFNLPPVADAGADQTITDSDDNGTQAVTLDGSGSSDPDGTISSYSWSVNGTEIATTVNPTVDFAIGTHTVALTVTDDKDTTATDQVTITVKEKVVNPPIVIESFEYDDNQALTNVWSSQNSGYFAVSLSENNVTHGSQSMRVDYNMSQKIGAVNWNFNGDFGEKEGVAFSLAGDNSGRTVTFEFKEQSGERWEASTILRGPEEVFFAFADMTLTGSASGTIDPSTFTNFSIFVDGEPGEGVFYIDNIRGDEDALVNSYPVVFSGGDRTTIDPDENGSEDVAFDASSSYDPDGSIVSYVWSDASGSTLATGAVVSINFPTGDHVLTLTVTDNEGLSATETINVKVLAPGETLGGFKVSGTKIIDAYGGQFIPRGINVPHAWFKARTEQSLVDIANYGTNSVRVVLATGDQYARVSGDEIKAIIKQCKNLGIVPVLEVHDATGFGDESYAPNAVHPDNMVDYWLSPDIRAAIDGEEEYVIINIANEPFGNSLSASDWKSWHIGAIDRMRSAGIGHALMIDAPNWGQDWTGIMAPAAEEVFASDPDANTIFSVHMYEVYATEGAVRSYIQQFVDMNLPIVVGEFADTHNPGQEVAEQAIFDVCQEYGLGYYGWSWSGNGGGLELLDIVADFNGSQLTVWGEKLINGSNGIAETSVEASIFATYDAIPYAVAGRNISTVDFSGTGIANVDFDGSASYDLEGGSIVSYEWAIDGVPAATGVAPTIELAVGTYEVSLTVTDDGNQTDTDVITVSVYGLYDRFNAALSKPVTASTTKTDAGGPDVLVDGDYTTRWSSDYEDGQWVEIDLELNFNIDEVVIRWEGAYTKNYSIEMSEDGTNWTSLYATSQGEGGVESLTVNGTGRYLKLNLDERATQWGNSIWEIEAFGTLVAPPNDLPTAVAGSDIVASDEDGDGVEAVTLDGSASTDTDGTITSYSWSDGTSIVSTDSVFTTNLGLGDYIFTLTVVDNGGASSSDDVNVKVYDPNAPVPPTAVATASGATDLDEDGFETITLDGAGSSDVDGTIISYVWTNESGVEIATGEVVSVDLAVGSHEITLTVTDNDGESTSTTVTAVVSAPAVGGFTVSGTQVLDANGNPFVMRGVNVPHAWFTSRTSQSLIDIAATGANAVRVVLTTGDRWTRIDGESVASIIEQCKTLSMIPILEVHDATGWDEQNGSVNPDLMLDYWLSPDIRAAIDGEEQFVMINIANEPFGNTKTGDWKPWHINAIQTLRDAGIEHTLMVDAPNWGQDWSGTMIPNAQDVFDSDPNQNVIFSVHMYEVYANGTAVENYMQSFYDMNLPLVVGEFADTHGGSGNVDEATILRVSEELGYGYLGWSWSGNGGGLEALDIVEGFEGGNYTVWGDKLINGVNGITATSEPASIFDNILLAPNANAGLDQLVVDADEDGVEVVTLDGSASRDNSGIVSYDWTLGGAPIATGVSPTVELPQGVNVITLVVTDDTGLTATDEVIVEVLDKSARFNVALGKPATASSDDGFAGGPEDAVDGDPATRWASEATDPQWLSIDLESLFVIDEVVINWEFAYSSAYDIEMSEDGINWETIYSTTSGNGGIETIPVAGMGRYIRLTSNQRGTVYGNSIWEFEAYGTILDPNDNEAPIANAGADFTIYNFDGSGTEEVILNGSESYDPDGAITGYSWTNASNVEIATTATASIELPVGTHTFGLVVTDIFDAVSKIDYVTVTVAEDAGLTNIALNKPVVGSSTDGSGPVSAVVDGNTGSRWSSDYTDPQWVEVDLGATYDIAGVVLRWEAAYSTAYQIQVSDDATNWTDIYATTGGQGGVENIPAAGTGQYIRLYSTGRFNDNWGVSLWEFEVYGTLNDGINQAPIANAGVDQTIEDADNNSSEIILLDGSGSTDDSGITSYSWKQDGVEIATGVNPSVDFAVGLHTITLVVTDAEGLTSSDTVVVDVVAYVNQAPIANAGVDQSVTDTDNNGNETITLDGSGSTDDSGISSYSWTLGGVEIATGLNPVVNLALGTHTITLMVTDAEGLIGSDSVIIEVLEDINYAPVANAGADQTIEDLDNSGSEIVCLDGSASTDDNGIVSYSWSINGVEIAIGVNPCVELAVGTYTITLTVTDAEGLISSDDLLIVVNAYVNNLPIANAGANQTVIDNDDNGSETVSLDGSGSSDVEGIISYSWSLDGAEFATGVAPDVQLTVGTHTITLTVTDTDSVTATDEVQITVEPYNPNPVSRLEAEDAALTGVTVQSDVTASGAEYVYMEGAGSITWTFEAATAGPKTIYVGYMLPFGDKTQHLTVNGNYVRGEAFTGTTNTWLEKEIEINAVAGINTVTFSPSWGFMYFDYLSTQAGSGGGNNTPVADAGSDQFVKDTDDSGSETITLDGSASADDYGITSYSWLLEGTEIATGVTANVDLAVGTYTITLTVADAEGLTSSDEVVITVLSADQNDPSTLEAEDATLSGVTVGTDALASNSQYVDMQGAGSITWTFEEATAGTKTVYIGYLLPHGDKTQHLSVNGNYVRGEAFTGETNTWLEKPVEINVVAGSNTVSLSASWGFMYFDYLSLSTSGLKSDTNFKSVTNFKSEEYVIYPNPAKDEVNIKGADNNTQYRIIDISGAVRMIGEGSKINVSELSQGIYFIVIDNSLLKLMKQ